jgi:MRG-binding protein
VNPEDEHTSIPGIWKKLETLYDLEGLDEREDSLVADVPLGTTDKDGDEQYERYWKEFDLSIPGDHDLKDLMWDRRLAPEGTSSPEMSRRESTVADTDEPRSSPIPGKSSGRGGRSSARKSGRLSRLQNEFETEKSSRRTSQAGSHIDANADEDQEMEDAEEEHAEESEEGEDDEEDAEDGRKTTGKRGGRGGARARGRGRTRRAR